MSVFFGYTGDGRFLPQMANKLRHWKPDREGKFEAEDIGLGCLEWDNVEPEERNPQPIRYKHYVVVGDIRLDNRLELLKFLDIDLKSNLQDLELVIRLYEQLDKETPKHLIGDFAFLIWDSMEKRVFGARDHLGIKVFYFARVGDVFVFASEIKGVLAYPGVDARFHEEFLVRSFTKADLPLGRTLYNGVNVLRPAHTVEFSEGKLKLSRYWELGDHRVIIPESHEERLRVFKNLFYQAVKDRLRTPGQIGVELSGGLDSTGIAAAANDLLGAKVPLYPYSFAKPEEAVEGKRSEDDNEIVREFCDNRGMLPFWKKSTEKDIDEHLLHKLYKDVLDEFDDNGVPVFTSAFLQKAKMDGVKVMLSGWGGDQGVTLTVGGFYRPMALQRNYKALWKDIRRKHGSIMSLIKWAYFAVKFRNPKKIEERFLKAGRKFLGGIPLHDELLKRYQNDVADNPFLKIKTATDIRSYLKAYLSDLEVERRIIHHGLIGRHFGVDYRFPMLDVRLLEYIYALPLETLTKQGKSRYLFTEIMGPSLPKEILVKRKSKVPTVPFFKAFQTKILPYLEKSVLSLHEYGNIEVFFSSSKIQELAETDHQKRYNHLSNLFFLLLKYKANSK